MTCLPLTTSNTKVIETATTTIDTKLNPIEVIIRYYAADIKMLFLRN